MMSYPNLIQTSILLTILLSSCGFQNTSLESYRSETLQIKKLSENTYVHISWLNIPHYGKFPCNGVIFKDGTEAIILDTPTSDSVSMELISWVENQLRCQIKAVVANHFHVDCLGGLKAFHDNDIASYANNMCIDLAKADSSEIPKNGFNDKLEILIGKEKVINEYFGEGHTKDNIVSYIPSEKILFGGCMIKALKAGKGNLKDANTKEWSKTVKKIKETYKDIKIVVPGHGESGGTELLDYTIDMFRNE